MHCRFENFIAEEETPSPYFVLPEWVQQQLLEIFQVLPHGSGTPLVAGTHVERVVCSRPTHA